MRAWKKKKKHYLCIRNIVLFKPNRTMKREKTKQIDLLTKMVEDKKAIQKCIREKGDLKKIALERNVKFVTPL